MLSNDPVTHVGKRQGESGFCRMKKCSVWAVPSSPLHHAIPQGALGMLGDIQVLHGNQSCSLSRQKAGGKSLRCAGGDDLLFSACRRGAVPVDTGVSRNKALREPWGDACVLTGWEDRWWQWLLYPTHAVPGGF